MSKLVLDHAAILKLCRTMGERMLNNAGPLRAYAVPRGGVPVLYVLAGLFPTHILIAQRPEDADCFVDDLIDSGATMERMTLNWDKPFFAMIDKRTEAIYTGRWIVFPWEGDETKDEGIEGNIQRILQFVGEDPNRGGLAETPARVARAWQHWCSGYGVDIAKLLKTFEDGAEGCDEMVVVKDIPFYTHCEHHMAAFFGTATVAYIPDKRIVGLSKLARVVDAFAHRLQVQERLTNQIADALTEHLKPTGVGVIIKARHLCMESRGIQKQGHVTITSALRGAMREQPAARAEFLNLTK